MYPTARRYWHVCLFGSLFLLASLALPVISRAAENRFGVEAYTVMDNETGRILESVRGNKKRQVASLTKIATAKVVLDWAADQNINLGQWAVVPDDVAKIGGANPVGLAAGDFISLRDLIYCALLQSDNIACHTLATHVGRALKATHTEKAGDLDSVGTFVAQMNALARSVGMNRTLFLNPHGAEPSSGALPYSTSDDLASLSRYAMNDKGFRFYVSQPERKITYIRNLRQNSYLLRSTNELLGYEGIDGVKTGRTNLAGDCLVISSAKSPETREEGGKFYVTPRRVTVVLLGATDRFAAGRQLLARAWQLETEWAAKGRP